MKILKNKKILIFGFSIIILLATIVILIVKNVIPNPFLDTKDLICTKKTYEVEYESKRVVTIEFDKWANSKNFILSEEITFIESNKAKEFFDKMKKSIGKDWGKKISIDDKKISINENIKLEKKDISNKKQIKVEYEEMGYECK